MYHLPRHSQRNNGRLCVDHLEQPQHCHEGAHLNHHLDGNPHHDQRFLWDERPRPSNAFFLVPRSNFGWAGAHLCADPEKEKHALRGNMDCTRIVLTVCSFKVDSMGLQVKGKA